MSKLLPVYPKTSWASRSLAERARAYVEICLLASGAIALALLLTQWVMPTNTLNVALALVLVDVGVLLGLRVFIGLGRPWLATWLSLVVAALIGTAGMHYGGGVATLSLGIFMILILVAALVFLQRRAAVIMALVSVGLFLGLTFLEVNQILPAHNITFNQLYVQETRLIFANTLLGVILLSATTALSGRAAEQLGQWGLRLEAEVDSKGAALHQALLHQQHTNALLQQAYDSTLEGWARAVELRDAETGGHTRRVVNLAVNLATRLHLPEDQITHLRRGAMLHDIGKLAIPDAILLKPGPLTDDEMAVMRQHPRHAYDMLHPISYLRPALDIPYAHHERWDGTGYPCGLAGEAIPLAARIFALADVYDALTSDRPYRSAWDTTSALAYIRLQAGRHFDPHLVEPFLHMLAEAAEAKKQAVAQPGNGLQLGPERL